MKYIIIILLFTSCSAAKHFKKGIKKDRVYFAKATRDSFPCTELFRTDTAFVYTDSTVWIECPDYTSRNNETKSTDKNNMSIDTTRLPNKTTIYIPYKLRFLVNTITKYVEDSAKIVIAQKETAKANNEAGKYKSKAERRGNFNLYLIIALLSSLLINFIQFKRK